MKRTLSEEFIAEFQIEANRSIEAIRNKIQDIKEIQISINKVGFFNKIGAPSTSIHDIPLSYPINVGAISMKKKVSENIWGKTIGVHVFAAIFKYSEYNKIDEIIPISTFRIFQENLEIEEDVIFLKVYKLFINALEELIEATKLDLLILDLPILITKHLIRDPSKFKEPEYYKLWEGFNKNLNMFWKKFVSKLYPFDKNGMIFLSLSNKNNPNLLKLGDSITFKNYFEEFGNLIEILDKIDDKHYLLRICKSMLKSDYRTVSFPLIELIDKEWQPIILNEYGIITFFYKVFHSIYKINIIGTYQDWGIKKVNSLCKFLNNFIFTHKKRSSFFPLWYVKMKSEFSKKLLDYYNKKIESEVENEFR